MTPNGDVNLGQHWLRQWLVGWWRHYLNQCWLIINDILWHSIQGSIYLNTHDIGPIQWRHDERDGVSNHQPHESLRNPLFKCRSKKTPKLRVTGLCVGKSPVIGEFPAQRPVTWKMFPFDDVIMYQVNFEISIIVIRTTFCRGQCVKLIPFIRCKHINVSKLSCIIVYSDQRHKVLNLWHLAYIMGWFIQVLFYE